VDSLDHGGLAGVVVANQAVHVGEVPDGYLPDAAKRQLAEFLRQAGQ
jgi:hypothetical protein